jgi:hypothetical protein
MLRLWQELQEMKPDFDSRVEVELLAELDLCRVDIRHGFQRRDGFSRLRSRQQRGRQRGAEYARNCAR